MYQERERERESYGVEVLEHWRVGGDAEAQDKHETETQCQAKGWENHVSCASAAEVTTIAHHIFGSCCWCEQ